MFTNNQQKDFYRLKNDIFAEHNEFYRTIASMKKLFFVAIILSTLVGCGTNSEASHKSDASVTISYAKGFSIDTFDGYTVARVRNPWDTTKTLHTYILVPADSPMPSELPEGDIVRTPLERVAVSSGVHSTLLEALGCEERINAVCDPQYMSHDFVKKGLSDGTIKPIGHSYQVDVEALINSDAQVIVMSPFDGVSYGALEKCGLPIIECASYLESEPLGQTEWLKFHAAFYDKLDVADSLFKCIEARYDSVRNVASRATERPKILSEKRFGQVWYVPGGASYAAALFRDAATDYPWSDDSSTGSLSFSFEQVVEKASDADIWLIRYNAPTDTLTYDDMLGEYQLYELFTPFKNRKIYTCNTAVVPYYETAITNPDKVLSDIVKIAHPEMLEQQPFYYYTPMYER